MTQKTAKIRAYASAYDVSFFDCVNAVCDVCDLDNDEIADLNEWLLNGDRYANAVSQTYPNEGNFIPAWEA